MANAVLHDTANFLRWRLVPVRITEALTYSLVGEREEGGRGRP